jgi:hypothetical protein
MNEHIKQFERDSGLEIYGLGQDRVKWKSVVEKFAQLIVRECATVAYNKQYKHSAAHTAGDCAKAIKQHFEVNNVVKKTI